MSQDTVSFQRKTWFFPCVGIHRVLVIEDNTFKFLDAYEETLGA